MNEIPMSERVVDTEITTTEVLVQEGNYQIEIEGVEFESTRIAPVNTADLVEIATAQAMGELSQADIVTFDFMLPEFAPNPLELAAPGAAITPAAQPTTARLRGEAGIARGFETEIQRGYS